MPSRCALRIEYFPLLDMSFQRSSSDLLRSIIIVAGGSRGLKLFKYPASSRTLRFCPKEGSNFNTEHLFSLHIWSICLRSFFVMFRGLCTLANLPNGDCLEQTRMLFFVLSQSHPAHTRNFPQPSDCLTSFI